MKKQWRWVICIVTFCALTPIVSMVIFLGIRSHAEQSGSAIAAQFLDDLRGHNYAKAHALMALPEQAAVSVTATQKAQEQIEKKKGSWLFPAEPNECHPSKSLDDIWYLYIVRTKPDGNMYISVRAVQTVGGWRVLEYHYDDDPA